MECSTRQASYFMTCGDQDAPDGKQRVEKARYGRRSDENFHAILEVYFTGRRLKAVVTFTNELSEADDPDAEIRLCSRYELHVFSETERALRRRPTL
jgi:hypothetical protein